MSHDHSQHEKPTRGVPSNWVLMGFFLIAGFFLLTEHRAHLFGLLPWLLLLACPLMHFFGHGHHGGQSTHHPEAGDESGRKED